MQVTELYASVTRRIVAELEQGAAPWTTPWKTGRATGGIMPVNAVTGHRYRGINIPILWSAVADMGYERHGWLTFKQATDRGASVRKGEKGTAIVFTRQVTIGEEDEERTISMLRVYYVFNVAQIDNFPIETLEDREEPDIPTAADHFIAATKADIRHGGSEAMFIPSKDFIMLPPIGAFKNVESYFATKLHELGHWSGHESRLNRELKNRFGTRAYAAEELIAEMTSAFLCAHLGVTGELRHAGYIEKWLELLRSDDRAIFTAASRASQAADYLRAFSEPPQT